MKMMTKCTEGTTTKNASMFLFSFFGHVFISFIQSFLPLINMSINPQFQGHDQYDVMMGSVTSHLSYAANTPVDSPGFTTVCISTNGALVADLENSYITAKLKYSFSIADGKA